MNITVPHSIKSPSINIADDTCVPLTQVPFLEPRSITSQPSGWRCSRTCCRETSPSAIWISSRSAPRSQQRVAPRPITTSLRPFNMNRTVDSNGFWQSNARIRRGSTRSPPRSSISSWSRVIVVAGSGCNSRSTLALITTLVRLKRAPRLCGTILTMRRLAVFALVFALLAGCSSGIDFAHFPDALADARCTYFVRCGLVKNSAECIAYFDRIAVDNPSTQAAIDMSKTTYHEDVAEACFDAYAA